MYDSHTHISSEELVSDIDRLVRRFIEVGGKGILNVGYDPETSFESVEYTRKNLTRKDILIRSAVGLHPTLIGEHSPYSKPLKSLTSATHMFKMINSLLERNRRYIIAIGETGLDYFHLDTTDQYSLVEKSEIKQLQKQLFRDHVHLALEHDLPITIHTRDVAESTECITDALEICAEVGMGNLTGSFHSYTGNKEFSSDITNLGFAIGVNAIITYRSGESVRDMIHSLPIENILLETDAPYLPIRGKKPRSVYGEPADLTEIAKAVSEVTKTPLDKVILQTSENFEKIFRI
ncbi:TatD family hydrolase [Candidatus Nomurabacteria bacterium]|uniref:TatD family hydrolase n=1 Tax=Candidatus Dojkabacteria bacterium TaxID=2099670 RepID=A0A955I2V3_9BACT|nr:TatD family hydrolase [Candidatus Dojkabacteria bacterium]MCB9789918.1 TatD family hydrolase [Candidatus Nomurabacteria bacterium]MCB9803456.1 TatD family hydrolase [Candidatus Nomurabacteria bacterium]